MVQSRAPVWSMDHSRHSADEASSDCLVTDTKSASSLSNAAVLPDGLCGHFCRQIRPGASRSRLKLLQAIQGDAEHPKQAIDVRVCHGMLFQDCDLRTHPCRGLAVDDRDGVDAVLQAGYVRKQTQEPQRSG